MGKARGKGAQGEWEHKGREKTRERKDKVVTRWCSLVECRLTATQTSLPTSIPHQELRQHGTPCTYHCMCGFAVLCRSNLTVWLLSLHLSVLLLIFCLSVCSDSLLRNVCLPVCLHADHAVCLSINVLSSQYVCMCAFQSACLSMSAYVKWAFPQIQ